MNKQKAPQAPRPEFDKLIAKGKAEFDAIKPWYVERAVKVFEVHCLQHGEVIALEAVMPGRHERGHADGAVVIPLGAQLTSFRVRADGSMGYACQCGANSILLKEEAILNETHALYPHIEEQIETDIAARKKSGKKAPKDIFKRVKVK